MDNRLEATSVTRPSIELDPNGARNAYIDYNARRVKISPSDDRFIASVQFMSPPDNAEGHDLFKEGRALGVGNDGSHFHINKKIVRLFEESKDPNFSLVYDYIYALKDEDDDVVVVREGLPGNPAQYEDEGGPDLDDIDPFSFTSGDPIITPPRIIIRR